MRLQRGFTAKRANIVMLVAISVVAIVALAYLAGVFGPEGSPYNPIINPEDFVAQVSNQFFPLVPGTTFIYEGLSEDGPERNQMSVTSQTKVIMGVICVVVWDRVWLNGSLIEETYDWYAQDRNGSVWYFGEDSKELENGVVISTEGSWEAGLDGAKPGIVMMGQPVIGEVYRQEYLKGEAEDMAEVLALNASVSVLHGTYSNCLQTRDWTPLEPGIAEFKYYASGVGLVRETVSEGGTGYMDLVDIIVA
jgi:hypothetical protein